MTCSDNERGVPYDGPSPDTYVPGWIDHPESPADDVPPDDVPEPDGPVAIELFAGCGGMSLGMSRAGIDPVGYVEVDEDAGTTFKANHPDAVWIGDDARSVGSVEVAEMAEAVGGVDLVSGGPPCKGFSMIGDREVGDDRNALWREFIRIVDVVGPEVFVMENVPAIRSMVDERGRGILGMIARSAADAGYAVDWGVMHAERHGVPQKRRRLIMIGVDAGSRSVGEAYDDHPGMPEPTHADDLGGPTLPGVGGDKRPVRTVRDAVGDLPAVDPGRVDPDDPMHWATDHGDEVVEMMEGVPPGEQSPECDGERSFDAYKRKRWDEPSSTIHGVRKNRGPSTFHPEQDRVMTPREWARLQGFPDDFVWVFGSWNRCDKMIGNAVPPPLAEAIGNHLLDTVL